MTIATMHQRRNFGSVELLLGLALVVALVVGYAATYVSLEQGPWQTEQEGHGPFILFACGWLVWVRRKALLELPFESAPFSGWSILLFGLALMTLTRSQSLLVIEVATQIPVLLGLVLLTGGWRMARLLWFPLVFFIFSVPPPGWALDAITVPLKTSISDLVANLLYSLHYPIAQNGVIIIIGPYAMMVKDACSGMNSIFALSAIGIFYIHELTPKGWIRKGILALSILPIAVGANFVRVMGLILLAYYCGTDAVEKYFHEAMGVGMFIVAIVMFVVADSAVVVLAMLIMKLRINDLFRKVSA